MGHFPGFFNNYFALKIMVLTFFYPLNNARSQLQMYLQKYDKVSNEIFFPYKRVTVFTQLAEIIIVIGAFCVTILTCPVTITNFK